MKDFETRLSKGLMGVGFGADEVGGTAGCRVRGVVADPFTCLNATAVTTQVHVVVRTQL